MAPTVGNFVDKIMPSALPTTGSNTSGAGSADWRVVLGVTVGFVVLVFACIYIAWRFMLHREIMAQIGNPAIGLVGDYFGGKRADKRHIRWERLRIWKKSAPEESPLPKATTEPPA